MNCTEFENVVVDIARGEPMEASARREGLAHATGCERCRCRLANEQSLSGLLAVAAAEDAGRATPPEVERVLRSAFRGTGFTIPRGRRAWRLGAAGAVAAAVLVVMFSVMTRGLQEPRTAKMPTFVPPPAKEPTKVIAPIYRETRKPPARTLRASRRKPVMPRLRPAGEGREVATEFIPVVYDPEPVEHGRMVRVRLPRSALAAFGLPMNEQRAEETIQADVVLGEDGLARAVRFVK